MPASLSLRQGIAVKDSPPLCLKISAFSARSLQRFQAIGGETRHHHGDAPDAVLCQSRDGLVGVGLQPLGIAEARLEGQQQLRIIESQAVAQGGRRPDALGLVGSPLST